ncbi:octanoyl-[acyl-carrier-protein]:protein N-octanoyltransferase LIPT2, mitochondrial-like isoform X1 [Apostichopus japonicus]|uniref:octanoyl-[acyl-carrier-protein]:protein N-octanoyltransferase LIPT2, mitochondrial-like isoform X1 n=1 Tax=Stichopus japonicus TaxID=307972 RepID=UPI003AB5B10E
MARSITVLNLGKISYRAAWQVQRSLLQAHRNDSKNEKSFLSEQHPGDVLIICEHEPVYTVGIREREYSQDEERLKALGADFVRTDRGGLITFHGPGQLVGYPVINLKNYSLGLRKYVSSLEKVLIKTCEMFGLQGKTTKDTGVWIDERKIAAIGISCKRYITQHGVSLNCDNDLSWFDHVIPCGIKGKGVTSLSQELGRKVSLQETEPLFLNSFCDVFGCTLAADEKLAENIFLKADFIS